MFLLVVFGAIVGILIFDAYLKTLYAKKNPDIVNSNYQTNQIRKDEGGLFGWLNSNPDYSKPFSLRQSV